MDEESVERLRQWAIEFGAARAHKAAEDFDKAMQNGLRWTTYVPHPNIGDTGDRSSHLPVYVRGPALGHSLVEFDVDVLSPDPLSDYQYHGDRWLEGLG